MTAALDFLSPGLAVDSNGFHPVARSSMERQFRDAGATFEERDGWLVPVSAPGEPGHLAVVGVGDLSHMGKLEVRTVGSDPTGPSAQLVYRISPRRALVLCPTAATAELHVRLSAEYSLVLDVTAQHGLLVVTGPQAPTLLRRLTHLHRFPSSGDVAHVTAHVLAPAKDTYWIVVPQELGHYLCEVAVDRAVALGGGPVGVDALGVTP